MTKNRNVMVECRRCHSLKIDMEILILFAFASIMLSVIILVQLFKLNLLSNKCDLFDSPLLRGLKYTIYHTVEFPFMPSRVTMLIYICSWHAWHPCPSSLFAEHLPCTHARRARDPCIKWGFWLVVHNLDCVQGFWLVVQKLDLVQFVSPVSWSEQKW